METKVVGNMKKKERRKQRRGSKVLAAMIGGIISLVCLTLALRWTDYTEPLKRHSFRRANSIEEEVTVEIGGIPQYLNIRGCNKENPMILMIHGGCAMTPLIHTYQTEREKDFTVKNYII